MIFQFAIVAKATTYLILEVHGNVADVHTLKHMYGSYEDLWRELSSGLLMAYVRGAIKITGKDVKKKDSIIYYPLLIELKSPAISAVA